MNKSAAVKNKREEHTHICNSYFPGRSQLKARSQSRSPRTAWPASRAWSGGQGQGRARALRAQSASSFPSPLPPLPTKRAAPLAPLLLHTPSREQELRTRSTSLQPRRLHTETWTSRRQWSRDWKAAPPHRSAAHRTQEVTGDGAGGKGAAGGGFSKAGETTEGPRQTAVERSILTSQRL